MTNRETEHVIKPSPEQLRTMDARTLRDTFQFGLEEAKRLKVEQRIRDTINEIEDQNVRRAVLDLLFLVTGRVDIV